MVSTASQIEDEIETIQTYKPKDRLNLVFILVTLVGFGVLMPWNMFITVAPEYYVNYWFKHGGNVTWYSKQFMSALSISSQLPNASINIINLFLIISGPLIYRVFAPVCFNLVNVSIVLLLVIFVDPSVQAMSWFFWTTLGIVMAINVSNGLYENSILGVFADFPHKYTGALLIGNNMCGLLITLLKLIVTILIKDEVKLISIVYFSTSLVVLFMCGLGLFIITKQDFYHFYHEKGIEIRNKAQTHKPSAKILWETIQSCYCQLFNVWISFSITLTIFPVLMTATKQSGIGLTEKILPENEEIFTLVTVFLNFNLFSTIGSVVASKFHWPSPPNLVFATTIRALFVPVFFYCNYRPDTRLFPVYIKSTDIFVISGILMSFTHGYFSSLAMAYTPRIVEPHHSRFAAQLSACTLMIGLFTGAIWSLAIENIIDKAVF